MEIFGIEKKTKSAILQRGLLSYGIRVENRALCAWISFGSTASQEEKKRNNISWLWLWWIQSRRWWWWLLLGLCQRNYTFFCRHICTAIIYFFPFLFICRIIFGDFVGFSLQQWHLPLDAIFASAFENRREKKHLLQLCSVAHRLH